MYLAEIMAMKSRGANLSKRFLATFECKKLVDINEI